MKDFKKMNPLPLAKVNLTGGLLGDKNKLIREKVIPYQWRALNNEIKDTEPSHAVKNFQIAAGEAEGKHQGYIFQDSDVAKWLESVAYKLTTNPDEDLKKLADKMIETIEKAQEPDGYLNTYYTLVDPENRWSNLADCHELYCAGHMLEAAVAYFEATGETKLLNVMVRFVDHIDDVFGPEEGKIKGYPGHQEIELALMKLYKITGNPKHLELAEFFINERGKQPHYFDVELEKRGNTYYWPDAPERDHTYDQTHLPIREQKVAIGHAVRAVYMYAGMTDIAMENDDSALIEACETLWENTVESQMYVTGGIGSNGRWESFTFDYDMPNDTAYNETCASIGLILWAHRMLHLKKNSTHADILEKALYNGVLSGMSQDGERFFYVNPLEVWPEACEKRDDKKHVKHTRQKWFGCACCPPNIARLLTSIGRYFYSQAEETIFCHLYNNCTAIIKLAGQEIKISQETNYPCEGIVNFMVNLASPIMMNLNLRIPGWCKKWHVEVNGQVTEVAIENGYASVNRQWNDSDNVTLFLEMPVQRVYSNIEVRENAGKVVLQRGPIVYCLEEADNGKNLPALFIHEDASIDVQYDQELLGGVVVMKTEGRREINSAHNLYTNEKPNSRQVPLTFIPYYSWNNRAPGEMLVWIREK